MEQLTLLLFERMGLLLLITFILTRIPQFRYLLDRRMDWKTGVTFSLFFGLVSIGGTYAGVTIGEEGIGSYFFAASLGPDEAMADSALIGIVMAGLLGGVAVGTGAGILSGVHAYWMGGLTGAAEAWSTPVIGLLAGLVARFFAEERVIAPVKALFISVFAPVLQMGVILIATESSASAIRMVNLIGVPMVVANSIGVGIFVAMILAVLREEERASASETQRALHIAEMALPYLKQGLTFETAEATANILRRELRANAVAVTDTEEILAHVGIGTTSLFQGERIKTELSRKAIQTGEIQIAKAKEHIQPQHPALGAAIIVPFRNGGQVAGLIKLYYHSVRQIRPVEEAFAKGLSKLISIQLDIAMAEELRGLMKDAELKALQAQINPHFLFNTLNAIVTLIRVNPDAARRVTVQLGSYMRMNLTMTQSPLVPLYKELEHLQTYLGIVHIRFEDRLSVKCVCEPGLEAVAIPPSTLQPLVENSIHHGLKGRTGQGEILAALRRGGDGVQVTVEDNGSGFPAGLLDKLGQVPAHGTESTGLGLYNVNRRLINLFGPGSRLRFSNRPEGGARIEFTIPYQADERRESTNESHDS
ncbi:LytS/YhcK type 5TM receptor domain-containing protein [Paenibacillus validus]|uniref:LytS/YhcK type 5TM receptor domain-containing protein n=1 Tax=Paenibacillus TaxID=44249 RepID=UPI001914DC86|nr:MULTISPECIES: LytS/YhcK type 5TM receptor domain-containing protein [Paenibacillus]MED4604168.1 LytS/YhcK type 5TM receptor domain-containing protein [Paenibacillus validus]MED4609025.1 LytS/YhcK type 5TM receptor domain-containing protein [Paenibacillus validus]